MSLGDVRRRGVGPSHRRAFGSALSWVTERDESVAESQDVSVPQALTPGHTDLVDIGAVRRKPIVDNGPLAPQALERGVQPRNPFVPGERQIVVFQSADGEPRSALIERDDVLTPNVVAQKDERNAAERSPATLPKVRRR